MIVLSRLVLSAVAASLVLSSFPARADDRRGRAAELTDSPVVEPISAGPERHERELTVLTYNVKGLPWPIASGRRRALREIGRELGEMRRAGKAPDIVLIQEGFEDIGELVALSGYAYWAPGPQKTDRPSAFRLAGLAFSRARYLAAGEGWGKFTGAGLHVLSDFPVMEVESAPFFYCAGLDCLANKGVMLAQVEIPGLPQPLEVVNTHMNSRSAAQVPWGRSQKAHNLQSEELLRFVDRPHTKGAPLIVGGDFNVKNAPGRYYYKAEARPFVVVSQYCKAQPEDCRSERPLDAAEPWLASQDLQAFGPDGAVKVRPLALSKLFAGGESGSSLSDHEGILVRYRLSWEPGRQMVADLR